MKLEMRKKALDKMLSDSPMVAIKKKVEVMGSKDPMDMMEEESPEKEGMVSMMVTEDERDMILSMRSGDDSMHEEKMQDLEMSKKNKKVYE